MPIIKKFKCDILSDFQTMCGDLINFVDNEELRKKITYAWQNIFLAFVPYPDYFFWRVLECHIRSNCIVSKGMKKGRVKRRWNWHGCHQSMVASSWLTFLSLLFRPLRVPHQIPRSWCLKITEKVSFNIASKVRYVYILSGQKLIKNAKNGSFWRVFANLKLAVKQCYQTGLF